MDILMNRLYYYGLTMIQRDDKHYFLVDVLNGECFEDMSIYYIDQLVNKWSKNQF